MTNEEAIEILKQFKKCLSDVVFDEKGSEAWQMAIKALSQEPTIGQLFSCEEVEELRSKIWKQVEQEPCDEKRDCSTCKYEEYSSNYQPCRDCGTLLESYTNWEQKERELPCIYDLKNRYCPRLNEHGMLKYPLQEQTTPMSTFDIAKQFGIKLEPCDDVVSRILKRMWNCRGKHTTSIDKVAMEQIIHDELPSVTQKSGKWIDYSDEGYVECPFCGHATNCEDNIDELHYCFYCGAYMRGAE